ncbi:putative RNA-directed DNA polymerase [Senna tora]|uniref:Putative RNA-directed DNA polymerase n=1 Tax=Senna tora TaxID=362788 RepID=A0A834SIP1_9FABA|nr:putative RNA-directed DNA polymerase [Senna tora]
MAGRSLLAKGLRRSIGDGRTTRVWEDPWVPSDLPMVLAQPSNPTVVVEKVSELLTVEGVEWDVEKIRGLFNEEVCNQIVSIPPDKEQGGDRWVWEHDNKGIYYVKTGYRNAMIEEWSSFEMGLEIDSEGVKKFWKRMWKLPIGSKYKVFLWRVCWGILPTIEALDQRGLRINENCVIRVFHANALEWLVVEAGDWKDKQISALAIASYYAWERRNKKKFCNEVVRVGELWSRVERVMDETQVILCSSESNREHPTSLEWEKPASNFVKINVDAALKKDGGGVLGGLIRDEHSRCLGVFRNSVGYPNDPTKLEAMAVKQGLELALKVGCNKVIVEGDALLVMEMLNTPCDQASSLNALCRDVLRFCHNFQDVIFNWVPRTCNDVANLICRTDKVVQANVVWTDSVPFFLSEVFSV